MEHFNLTKAECIGQAAEHLLHPHATILFVAENVKDTYMVRDAIVEQLDLHPDGDLWTARVGTGILALTNAAAVYIVAPTKYAGRGTSLVAVFAPAKCFDDEDFVASVIPAIYSNGGKIFKY